MTILARRKGKARKHIRLTSHERGLKRAMLVRLIPAEKAPGARDTMVPVTRIKIRVARPGKTTYSRED